MINIPAFFNKMNDTLECRNDVKNAMKAVQTFESNCYVAFSNYMYVLKDSLTRNGYYTNKDDLRH